MLQLGDLLCVPSASTSLELRSCWCSESTHKSEVVLCDSPRRARSIEPVVFKMHREPFLKLRCFPTRPDQ